MKWNWQLQEWPDFRYKKDEIEALERDFLISAGVLIGALKHVDDKGKQTLIVDLITDEALTTSEIEGEMLDRDSLRSSIRLNLGFTTAKSNAMPKEQGMAEMITDLYGSFEAPLTKKSLCGWQASLLKGRRDIKKVGAYRTHKEPMQIVSGSIYKPKVHFLAPPSADIPAEMKAFLTWFNNSAPKRKEPLPILTRASIAHLYFVSIHPFEDGNGRIARALALKAIAQGLGQPVPLAFSHVINASKKLYYTQLAKTNASIEITQWVLYFSRTIVEARNHTQNLVDFLINKAHLFDRLRGKINPRQERALLRIFRKGIEGFKGGLSADNYMRITKASPATATRDLKGLVDLGALRREGKGKHTRYFLRTPFSRLAPNWTR